MKRESAGHIYTTVFVDYDNIYMSLKRKSEEAAKRFAKDSGSWLQAIVSGALVTPTTPWGAQVERRLAITRCYGNSQPRRNAHDNSTDMNSFPFVKHHFLRAGFEIVDCLPMTQQLKNAADIRMVIEIGDILNHPTFFDEVVILSGDADFTPLLHRLRAHGRRTIVFANDQTAQPYTALSDGEIRESNLIGLLLNGRALTSEPHRELAAPAPAAIDVDAARQAILAEVVSFVRAAPQAVPLETLADRALRIVGRDKTVGTNWGGYGTFHKLLLSGLPDDLHLSDTAPFTVFDENRHITVNGLLAAQPDATAAQPAPSYGELRPQAQPAPLRAEPVQRQTPAQPIYAQQPVQAPAAYAPPFDASREQRGFAPRPPAEPQFTDAPYAPPAAATARAPQQQAAPATLNQPMRAEAPYAPPAPTAAQQAAPPSYPEPRREAPRAQAPIPAQPPQQAQHPRSAEQATQIQQSIARIHQACQAPALAPAEYRVLFDVLAQEITANGLQGSQTLVNLTQRAREFGLDLKRDDLRFILDVVSESDPWFEQGASASLFASRFRNFVVARCRSQGLSLSADELDLVEAWFSSQPPQARAPAYGRTAPPAPVAQQPAPAAPPAAAPSQNDRWWSARDGADPRDAAGSQQAADDEFPRIVRTRLRG